MVELEASSPSSSSRTLLLGLGSRIRTDFVMDLDLQEQIKTGSMPKLTTLYLSLGFRHGISCISSSCCSSLCWPFLKGETPPGREELRIRLLLLRGTLGVGGMSCVAFSNTICSDLGEQADPASLGPQSGGGQEDRGPPKYCGGGRWDL